MPLGSNRRLSQLMRRINKGVVGRRLIPLLTTIEVLGLAIAAFGLWGFAQIADEVLEQETQAFDTAILLALQRIHTPWLDQFMLGATVLGEPTLLVVVTLSISTVLIVGRKRADGITLAIAALGAAGLNMLLKNVFARARPELWQRIVDVRYYSFPSGHAMVSLVIYGLIGYLMATNLKVKSIWVSGLTALLIGIIGFSRLYLGVHWPTDVIAGYAAGLVWLITCIFSLEIWRARVFHHSSTTKKHRVK